jgi:hypothetical protein
MLYNEMLLMFTEISEVMVVRYAVHFGEVENTRVLVRRLGERRQCIESVERSSMVCLLFTS